MNIEKISKDINNHLQDYEIGKIQQFWQAAKGLSRPKSFALFLSEPINENWTSHIGGRTELQFNIGNEDEGLRFGFAFCLETSRSLPNPEILYPKIRKLNYIIQSKPYLFEDYKMWTWKNGECSNIHSVKPITEQDISVGNVIFIGKIQETCNLSEIMETFDEMFPIYKEVESDVCIENQEKNRRENEFVFKKSVHQLPRTRQLTTTAKEINIPIRHSLIQEKLISKLKRQYGEDNVAPEHYIGLNRIDVVVRNSQECYFYEVKVANTARDCIRDAFGQLLDYCCYPSRKNATKIFVVGEHELDSGTEEYLNFINKEFNIPIAYLCIKL